MWLFVRMYLGEMFEDDTCNHFGESLPDDDKDSFFFSSPLTSLCMFCNSFIESFTVALGEPVLCLAADLELCCSDTGLVSRLADTEDSDSVFTVLGKPAVESRLVLCGMDMGSW